MTTSIFIFTRDLRLNDNLPLIEALKENKYVSTFKFEFL